MLLIHRSNKRIFEKPIEDCCELNKTFIYSRYFSFYVADNSTLKQHEKTARFSMEEHKSSIKDQ